MRNEVEPSKHAGRDLRTRARELTTSLKRKIKPEPIPRDELLRGIGVLADPNVRTVMATVAQAPTISGWEMRVQSAMHGGNISAEVIYDALTTLSKSGLVQGKDASANELTSYTPTRLGKKAYNTARSIR